MKTVFNLSLANPSFNGSLKAYTKDFKKACEYFNETSEKARTPKHMNIVEICDSYFSVIIESEFECSTRHLKTFTKYLLDNTELKKFMYFTSLFQSIRVAAPDTINYVTKKETNEEYVMKNLTKMIMVKNKTIFNALAGMFKNLESMEAATQKYYIDKVSESIKLIAQELGR